MSSIDKYLKTLCKTIYLKRLNILKPELENGFTILTNIYKKQGQKEKADSCKAYLKKVKDSANNDQ